MGVVEDVFKPLAMLLGLSYLISLMIYDACIAIVGKSARIWNPGKSLIINALTIQILSFLKIKVVKGLNLREVKTVSQLIEVIGQNRLVGEAGRVVTCVLIGYLLPGMAQAGSATDWRTLVALVLSLFTFEFYSLATLFYKEPDEDKFVSQSAYVYFYTTSIIANVVIVLSIILVVLFSISAILAGRTLRGMLAQKISTIQWDKKKDSDENSWEKFEGEILESWFLARVCDPQYVIARSVLISAVGVVVTICALFLGFRHIIAYGFIIRLLFYRARIFFMVWVLEWAFILIGGTVILCRWVTAAVYYPRFSGKKMRLSRCTRPFVEDYWTRSILELIQMYNLQKWHLQAPSRDGTRSGLAVCMATTMKLHYLLYLLWPLQISVVCFSKCCFFASELMFSFKFVQICLLGSDDLSFLSHKDSQKYSEILKKVCMPGENATNLWLANEKSLNLVKKYFNENRKKGCDCNDLITLIESHFLPESHDYGKFVSRLESLPLVAEHFPDLDENCMRMTALSLLNVIVNLLPLHKDVDRLTKAIEAYQQAFDIMSFVDDSDPQRPTSMDVLKVIDIEADRISVAVCNEFPRLQKLRKEKTGLVARDAIPQADPEKAPKSAFEAINALLKDAEEQLKVQKLININREEQSGGEKQNDEVEEQYCDSRDWSAIAGSYSKYRVCKLILSHNFNENELIEYLYGSLADVIIYCLLKSPNVLVKRCREWAIQFEEEKIWDAMLIAGKLVGVVQKYNEVKENFPEPLLPTCKDHETQTVPQSDISSSQIPTTNAHGGDVQVQVPQSHTPSSQILTVHVQDVDVGEKVSGHGSGKGPN